MPSLFSAQNQSELTFPDSQDGQYAASYLSHFLAHDPSYFIQNVQTSLHVLRHKALTLPLTMNRFSPENSYVCSPYTHYVQYAHEEVPKLPNLPLRWVANGLLRSLDGIFRACHFDECVYVNNWLLSTNLYPQMETEDIRHISEFLISAFPDRPIVWRSVDGLGNPILMDTLQKLGYRMAFSRQVFYQFPENGQILKVRNIENDLKLYRKSSCQWLDHEDLQEKHIERILLLYKDLYLDKYSHFNPQFTFSFIQEAIARNWLRFRCITLEGEIVAVLGSFQRRGTMAQPIFGYDTTLPQALGLYRLLTARTFLDSVENDWIIHASAGVGRFKKTRGGRPALEFNAVFDQHLPLSRRFPWAFIEKVLGKIGIPLLQKYEL